MTRPPTPRPRRAAALALAAAALVGGCAAPQRAVAPGPGPAAASGAERDGAPLHPPADLERVPDAEPVLEPIRAGGPNKPYAVLGRRYVPITRDTPFTERGLASWYGRKFQGRRTASGEIYNMYAMTAAHPTLPIPSYVRVRNPANGREVVLRVNDRGPFHAGRIIDLSYTAALKLDLLRGVAPVEVQRLTLDDIRSGAWRHGDAPAADAPEVVPVSDTTAERGARAERTPITAGSGARSVAAGSAGPGPDGAGAAAAGPAGGAASPGSAAAAAAGPGSPGAVLAPPGAASADAPVGPVAAAGPVATDPVAAGAGAASDSAAPPVAPRASPGAPASGAAEPGPVGAALLPDAATPPRGDPADTAGPVADAPRARAFTAAARGFWIQLGAFRRRDGAERLEQRVAAELDGLAPLLAVFDEAALFRVQAGPYPSRDAAAHAARRIRDALRLVPLIVERR